MGKRPEPGERGVPKGEPIRAAGITPAAGIDVATVAEGGH
jgi:hypothetical protein